MSAAGKSSKMQRLNGRKRKEREIQRMCSKTCLYVAHETTIEKIAGEKGKKVCNERRYAEIVNNETIEFK